MVTAELDPAKCKDLSSQLSLPVLTRTWQMLLKGIAEVDTAPSPVQAAEMVLVRIACASDLPSPTELIEKMSGRGSAAKSGRQQAGGPDGARVGENRSSASGRQTDPQGDRTPPASFPETVALFENHDALIHAHLINHVHLVEFETGKISVRLQDTIPDGFLSDVGRKLDQLTGQRWVLESSSEAGQPTLWHQQENARRERKEAALEHPVVQRALKAFPDAKVVDIRTASSNRQKAGNSGNPN